jgi:hypothetical protein
MATKQKQKLTPGQKAARTRKRNQKVQAKINPSAKQKAKAQAKQKQKKQKKPFGGKVVSIASLCTALQTYGKNHRTQVMPPTEVVKVSWAVIHKEDKPKSRKK